MNLMEKQTALVAFFSWGRGYVYYTAVIYPYERKDGRLWLLMGLSEGILKLDDAWALEEIGEEESLPPVPVARKKPKVMISKVILTPSSLLTTTPFFLSLVGQHSTPSNGF